MDTGTVHDTGPHRPRGGGSRVPAVIILMILMLTAGFFLGRGKTDSLAGMFSPSSESEWLEEEGTRPKSSDTLDTREIVRSLDDSRMNAIVRASQLAGPSVVSVSVTQTVVARRSPFFGDDFFQHFFGDVLPPTVYRQRVPSLGSGFVISKDGHIISNEHVIHNAEEIKVTLPDGRQFDAKVVGSNAAYDIAVLKIDAKGLRPAAMGDSDDLVVGEWAIAIGNPFGFLLNDPSPSVTAGVISALKRDVKSESVGGSTGIYKSMIQTDAAINPGNSGGPLVNGKGEVIGVNTFIFTRGGGSLGMGFAIPVNTAKRVVREIINYGAVRGVWIGISVQDITPYLAQQLDVRDTRGVIVVKLEDGSPADKAGVKVGDIIRKVQGVQVENSDDAARSIFGAGIGDVLTLSVERDGRTWEAKLKLVEVPKDDR
ncbi:MAG: trypsin-like peptidase domain-containing protein, partial [Candidatus Eisenbacteria bacterium]|nr:trypsin-like peptidase domain-containing protein [Candidatus Eisenbacteria bacterium]